MDEPSKATTVLVVDDERAVADMVAAILRVAGYQVVTVYDERTALALCEQRGTDFSLALLDCRIPGMGGPLLSHSLTRIVPGLRVALMSGYIDAPWNPISLSSPSPFRPRSLWSSSLPASREALQDEWGRGAVFVRVISTSGSQQYQLFLASLSFNGSKLEPS
jgi:CheY-like chemotaxis protein